VKTILRCTVLGSLAVAAAVAACNTDGVTPNCPDGGGVDCVTEPGDVFASYPQLPGDDAGTQPTDDGASAQPMDDGASATDDGATTNPTDDAGAD
jgi:hypothetical protein